MKNCSICKLNKNVSEFYKDKRTKDGLYSSCRQCHGKKCIESVRINKKVRNKYLIGYRLYQNEYQINRRIRDPKFRLDHNITNAIWWALKEKKEGRKWGNLVGYTIQDLTKHLEKQFDTRMTWDNYGSYWWIDHIKPKSLFKYETAEDSGFKECWRLENLQPLEAKVNQTKSNKYVVPNYL